jgi:hypothetical protein
MGGGLMCRTTQNDGAAMVLQSAAKLPCRTAAPLAPLKGVPMVRQAAVVGSGAALQVVGSVQ